MAVDPEIKARALHASLAAQTETELLKAQLETARKALERIALGQTMSASIAARALAQISAEQKGGK